MQAANSSDHPLVSVVLPVYNGQKYLAESVESVLNQTFRELELIIVDDASTDRTPLLAEEFQQRDPRVRLVRNPVNRKLPGSLNAGFALARGAYLTWTSDDNRYLPEAIGTMAAELERDPAVGLVYASCDLIDEAGRKTGRWKAATPQWLYCHNVVKACFLYRASLQRSLGGYDEGAWLMEDWDFWLRAAAETRLRRIRRRLYEYRLHGGSLTATRLADIVRAQLRVLGGVLDGRQGIPRRIAVRSRLFLAMGACKIGEADEADRQMARARALSLFWGVPATAVFFVYRLRQRLRQRG